MWLWRFKENINWKWKKGKNFTQSHVRVLVDRKSPQGLGMAQFCTEEERRERKREDAMEEVVVASPGNSGTVVSAQTEALIGQRLLDPRHSIAERWRALFALRNLRGDGPRQALIAAMSDASNLLAHEAAFALGQMQDAAAIPALRTTLQDIHSFHPIVRHEAAEALGAIGAAECVAFLLESCVSDPAPEVRETCELALRRIHQGQACDDDHSPFLSVDPAAPAPSTSSVTDLRKVLLDEGEGMYERYAALFSLRNRAGADAVAAIVTALQVQSALLRHEVAYVLGQLQDKAATQALARTLKDVAEHPMVRHEAAEALGSIADEESVELLKAFQKDYEPIVSQSCEVALCMIDLERQGTPFELLQLEMPI